MTTSQGEAVLSSQFPRDVWAKQRGDEGHLLRDSRHFLDSIPPTPFCRVQTSICAGGDVLDVVAIDKGRYPEAGRCRADFAEIG